MAIVRALRELQSADHEADEKLRALEAAKRRLADQSELLARREAQRAREDELASQRARLRNLELELKGLSAKAREVEQSLYGGSIRSPKELESLQQDGENLRRRISTLEDQILAIMGRLDELEPAIARGAEALQSSEASHVQAREQAANQVKVLSARLAQLRAIREGLRAQIGRTDLALYDELRARKAGVALAMLRDGTCQLCRVSAPVAKAQAVVAGERTVTCEGCGRILYHG